MPLIDELKRRNVIKVGAAYLALAWLVLQLTSIVVPEFGLPAWTMRLVIWFGVIGFPFVLIFSWAYELTPEGLKREREVDRSQSVTHLTGKRLDTIIIGMLAVAIGLFLLQYLRPPASEAPASKEAVATPATSPAVQAEALASLQPAAETAPDDKSIAVLPFDNRSKLEDDAFFVDGVHDDILTQLARIGALKVVSRTSVERFRHTELSMREIAAQLGVSKILEGAVQRAGDRVRINVQLIDADSDAHLWAETYDRELTTESLFAIQSEVAAAIAKALEATLTTGEQARVAVVPTQDLAAWESYQLGRQRMARRTSAALEESAQYFRAAIKRDPAFALAYAGLADALVLRILYGGLPSAMLAEADAAVGKALAIDPGLAEAWAASGQISLYRYGSDRAESLFRRAIELGPNYAPGHQWYGAALRATGRTAEALQHVRRAVQLDPLSPIINTEYALSLDAAGRFDEAEARNRKAIEIDPSIPRPYLQLGLLYSHAFNRFAPAIAAVNKAVELDPGNPGPRFDLAILLWDLGDDVAAIRQFESIRQRWPDHELGLAAACLEQLLQGEPRAARLEAERLLVLNPRDWVGLPVLLSIDLEEAQPERAYARYARAFSEFLAPDGPRVHAVNLMFATQFALLSQATGKGEQASVLLAQSERVIGTMPRLGTWGYWIADVQVHALRGERDQALRALRAAEQTGWRAGWRAPRRYYRDLDPTLASIRDAPEFKAVFADIERDMAAQRAALAAVNGKPES